MSILHRVHHRARRHYEKYYAARYTSRAHLVFLLDAALVTIALSLLGLGAYFRWGYHPLRDDFRIAIVPDAPIVAGQETGFEARITNVGKGELRDGLLTLKWPANFVPKISPDAYNAADGSISIASLPAGASASYRFRGTLFGPAQTDRIYARFAAKTADGRSDEKLSNGDFSWTANAIETRFDLPAHAVPGQTFVFKVHIKNGSAYGFDDATLTPGWPDGAFKLQNATPPISHGRIALGRLDPGEETVLGFSGRFTALLDPASFEATLRGTLHGRPLELSAAQANVGMTNAGAHVSAAFVDPKPDFVKPGQEVPVIVRYRNDGDHTLKSLTLSIAPDARFIAGTRWETSNAAGDLAPSESGERKAYVRILGTISQATDPVLRIVPQATFLIDAPRIDGIVVPGGAVETRIAGSASLRVAARYFTADGDQIGRGPLPPRVGKATRYWIFASLETGSSALQDGRVAFTLPSGVAWTGRAATTSGDELHADGDGLFWRIGEVGAHAGSAFEAPSASFEVALTPIQSQIGTGPKLLENAAFDGTDSWTGIALHSVQDGLTTRLTGDTHAAGRTLVAP